MIRHGFRNVLSVALVVCLLLIAAPQAACDVEPNDTLPDAELIAAGIHQGELPEDDETDYYAFAVHGGDIVTVRVVEPHADPDIRIALQSEDGSGLGSVSAVGPPELTVITPAEIGERAWYLRVTGEGPYRFALEVAPQNDAGLGVDAPEDRDRAPGVEPGIIEGLLGDDDEYDAYSFTVRGGEIVYVAMAEVPGGAGVELALRDHEGSRLESLTPEGRREVTWLTPAELGRRTWYLVAYGEGPYRIMLNVISQDDGQTLEVTLTADFSRFDREMNWLEATVRDAEGSNIGGLRSAGAANPDTLREGPLEIEQAERWTVIVGTEGDYVLDLRITGADGTPLARVEQLSAVDWQALRPVEDPQQAQLEPHEESTPEAQEMQPQPQAQQPVEIEEQEQVPADEVVPVEGPVYARILVDSVYCVSESRWDRGTNSDEPYFIITGYATDRDPAAWSTGSPHVFQDVDDRENRRFPDYQRVVFEGEVTDGAVIGFTVLDGRHRAGDHDAAPDTFHERDGLGAGR